MYHKRGIFIIGLVLLIVFSSSLIAMTEEVKRKTLSLWTPYPAIAECYESFAKDYMELHPNVEIKISVFTARAMEDKLAVTMAAGTAGDILQESPFAMARYIAVGLVNRPPVKMRKHYTETTFSFLQPGGLNLGEIWGIPSFVGLKFLFWNKQMFKESGLSRAPKTIDELVDYARKLARYDKDGNLIRSGLSLRLSGGGYGIAEKWWVLVLAPYGGTPLIETAPGKYCNGFDTPEARKALKFYIDMLYKYKVDSFKIEHDSAAFARGLTAMYEREAQVVAWMEKIAPDIEYGIAPIPGDVYHGTLAVLINLFVNQRCVNKDVAWDFISFLLNPENTRTMFLETGWNPVRGDVDYTPVYKTKPILAGLLDFPEGYGAYFYPTIGPWNEIWTKAGEWLADQFKRQELLDNPEGIAAACGAFGKIEDDILKEYDLYAPPQ